MENFFPPGLPTFAEVINHKDGDFDDLGSEQIAGYKIVRDEYLKMVAEEDRRHLLMSILTLGLWFPFWMIAKDRREDRVNNVPRIGQTTYLLRRTS